MKVAVNPGFNSEIDSDSRCISVVVKRLTDFIKSV